MEETGLHSLIIWDVKSQEYSNNNKGIDGASMLDGSGKGKRQLIFS